MGWTSQQHANTIPVAGETRQVARVCESALQITEIDLSLPHRARDGYRDMRTKALLALLQRPLKVFALTDPEPISASLMADDLLSIHVKPIDLVGIHNGIPPV